MGYRWMKLDAGGLKVSDEQSGRSITISRSESGVEIYAGAAVPKAVVSNMAAATLMALEFMRTPAMAFEQAA